MPRTMKSMMVVMLVLTGLVVVAGLLIGVGVTVARKSVHFAVYKTWEL